MRSKPTADKLHKQTECKGGYEPRTILR